MVNVNWLFVVWIILILPIDSPFFSLRKNSAPQQVNFWYFLSSPSAAASHQILLTHTKMRLLDAWVSSRKGSVNYWSNISISMRRRTVQTGRQNHKVQARLLVPRGCRHLGSLSEGHTCWQWVRWNQYIMLWKTVPFLALTISSCVQWRREGGRAC